MTRKRWMSLIFTAICGLAATLAGPAVAQPAGFAADPADVDIKLVTFGVGDVVHQYFGHNAMWVRDRRVRWSALYNYGMFSFGGDMLAKYLKGRLTFWVSPTDVRGSFEAYRRMDRDIIVQELNLDAEAKHRIVARLLHDAEPEHRYYQYHHYYDNCSTRLRDVIDDAVGGQFKQFMATPAKFNYREHTRRYSERMPPVNLALMFWMNDAMEQPIQRWHETFLPLELSAAVEEFSYVNAAGERVPLVANRYPIYEGGQPPVPAVPSATGWWALLCGLLSGGLALGLGRWRERRGSRGSRAAHGLYQSLIGLMFGVPGAIGFFLWTATEWQVTYNNENQLLANPITLALLPLGLLSAFGVRWADRGARFACYALAIGGALSLVLKLLPAFDQDNWAPMALLLPLNLGLGAGHFLVARARRTDLEVAAPAAAVPET